MSVELSDLRRVTFKQLCDCSDPVWCNRDGGRFSRVPTYEPVTAAEVASACPTEVLIEVLVERGVLTIDHNVKWDDLRLVVEARFVSEWNPAEPVAGGVS